MSVHNAWIGMTAGMVLMMGVAWEPHRGALGVPSVEAQLYQPPLRGAPASRVGGGTRGQCSSPTPIGTTLSVLTPEHTGFTLQDQPMLYWFLSEEATKQAIEINLTDDSDSSNKNVNPLFETRLNPPIKPGIHRISLADYHVKLVPGVRYKWSVALLCDPEHRSRDIVSSGAVQLIDSQTAMSENLNPEAIQSLRARLGQVSSDQKPLLYANAGIWYDAVDSLSELIKNNPDNADLRQRRAKLFEEVDLKEAAAYDRPKP